MGKLTTTLLLTAAALAGPVAVPASAQLQAGGVGGSAFRATAPPVITGVSCRLACSGLQRVATGSTVRVSGRSLAGAGSVVFLGRRGRRDDVTAPVQAATDEAVDVTVPKGAHGGRVRVVGPAGRVSRASTQALAVGATEAPDEPLLEAHVDSKRVLLDGRSRPSVSFFLGGAQPVPVRVELRRDGDPVPVAAWTPEPAAPGTVQTIAWDGALAPAAPPEGRYEFRITVLAPAAARAGAEPAGEAPATGDDSVATGFLLVGHAFPVRGVAKIGMLASQRFGAGRRGHSHQGQDVFAACGTPLVAVHGGVIRYKAWQSAAGNYVVLREDGSRTDYAYMHLRDPALVARGQRVTTGQLLGYVGDTGDAVGCHLHFEKWPAPGWYSGGAPVDPLADLQAWPAA